MAPKLKTIAELGTIVPHGSGWRVKVKLGQTQANGPMRPTRRGAQMDLDAAQQCTSRDELLQFVTALSQRVETTSAAPQLQNSGGVEPTAASDGAHIAGARAQAVAKVLGIKKRRTNGAPQSTASGVPQPAGPSGSGGNSVGHPDSKKLLLQLKRQHYDAILNKRKTWEARPCRDKCGRQSIPDKLAVVDRTAVLQSGANTNDYVRIAEVRRYFGDDSMTPVEQMVVDIGAELLPDAPLDIEARVQEYVACYGRDFDLSSVGFVAMRLEWPHGAASTTCNQTRPSGKATSNAEAGVNKEQNDGDPHPTVQSSGDPHLTARVATNNQASHGNTPYQTFDARGRVRWGARECADKEGCGRVFCETCYPL